MDKRNFAFDRTNFIILAVGMIVVIIGFILMSGSGSNETHYDPDIFSARRIKVAPVVCLIGFVSMIYGVIHRPKDAADSTLTATNDEATDKSAQTDETASIEK